MKYLIGILLVFSIVIIYLHHSITFYSEDFEKKFGIKLGIKNDYVHYFYNQNPEPIYVIKNKALDKYVSWSFENKKHGLFLSQQQLIADINYISNIQYAAAVPDAFTLKYLLNKLNYTSNLSPFWSHIYSFGQLLLPIDKLSKKYTDEEKIQNWKQITKFGEKGIKFTCDKNKIEKILSIDNEKYFKYAYSKTGDFYLKYSNPCKSYSLPDYLAFNYFYYLKDLANAIKYYKIAGFHKQAPNGTIGMVSVINGVLGEHEKALYMFVNKIIGLIHKLKIAKTKDEIKNLEYQIKISQKRALEELNFYIISQADKLGKECNKNFECLDKKGYIKKVINNLIGSCSKNKYLKQLKSIEDIFNYPVKISNNLAKCIFLKISLEKGYIKNYQLFSPLIKDGYYKFDTKRGIWWVYKK